MYQCLTDFHLLTNLPKNLRKKNKQGFTPQERQRYKNQLRTSLVEYKDYWKFDKCYHNHDFQEIPFELNQVFHKERDTELANQIKHTLLSIDPLTQRVFYEKFNADFVSVNSNREISERMGYSEEWVRQRVHTCIQRLRETFPYTKGRYLITSLS